MKSLFTRNRRLVATAAALALAAPIMAVAMAASAAADSPALPLSLIDDAKNGAASITITKLFGPEIADATADGTEQTITATRVEGVTYQVFRHNTINLMTATGWEAAANLALPDVTVVDGEVTTDLSANWTELVGPHVTDVNGVIELTDLDFGLYLVVEVDAPAGVRPSEIPFVVAVPMTNPEGDAWMYDIFVYPKNETDDPVITKTVADADAYVAGDIITWEITLWVPSGWTTATITDVLDSRLDWVGNVVTTADCGEVNFDDGTLTLVVDFDATDCGSVNTLTVTFDTTVNAAGVIPNVPTYLVNHPSGGWTSDPNCSDDVENCVPVDPDDPDWPVTKWIELELTKVELGDVEKLLDGAEFDLYVGDPADGGQVVGSATTEDGKLSFLVRYSDFADNETLDPAVEYFLVETQAPGGFELLPTPIGPFTMTATGSSDVGNELWAWDNDGAPTLVELLVHNVPDNAGFPLPTVGGNRAILPTIAALIAVAGAVWLVRSRKQAA